MEKIVEILILKYKNIGGIKKFKIIFQLIRRGGKHG